MYAVAYSAVPGCKSYWHWVCDCGFDDNRNTDDVCQKCSKPIDCKTSGGCSWVESSLTPDENHCVRCNRKV